MKPEKNQGGLLIRLQELAGCQYLSDLHFLFSSTSIFLSFGQQASFSFSSVNSDFLNSTSLNFTLS